MLAGSRFPYPVITPVSGASPVISEPTERPSPKRVGHRQAPEVIPMEQQSGATSGSPSDAIDLRRRALAIWPRLDASKLARTCGEPAKVARLIERRTSLPRKAIVQLLGGEVER